MLVGGASLLVLTLASCGDGAPGDAGAVDAGVQAPGGSSSDAHPAGCRPERVTPFGGASAFALGVLCDDVHVCAANADDAARVTEVTEHFVCEAAAGPCAAWTCTFRNPGGPGVIDEAEYAEICAVTVLEPPLALSCYVYL